MMQTQSALIRQNRLANLLIEASPVSIVLTKSLGTIDVVNYVTESWFGYHESELVGKEIATILPLESSIEGETRPVCFLSQLRAPYSPRPWTLIARRKDGTEFPVIATLHPLEIVSGDMVLINVVRQSEPESNLQKRIAGERLSAVLEMVSGLAHGSRNALQRAQACLDLLEIDLADNAELMQLTDRIRLALMDLRCNYEQVKDYASPIMLNCSNVCLPQLCQLAFDQIAERYPQHLPRLRIQCDRECVHVTLDPVRMSQVFERLFENAIHASPPTGEVVVSCRAHMGSKGRSVEITVRDYGSGLTEEATNRMFEPFFTTKQRGTGLGLAVCRRIIDAHGGTIDSANHPDGGAVVWILLPTGDSIVHNM